MKLNLLVIRTNNLDLLKQQYELLGFSFDYHQHGKGAFHYASEAEGLIFEIYPLSQRAEKADSSLRLGFEVENLSKLLLQLEQSSWEILSEITQKPWGIIAVVQDRDGRKVELKQASSNLQSLASNY